MDPCTEIIQSRNLICRNHHWSWPVVNTYETEQQQLRGEINPAWMRYVSPFNGRFAQHLHALAAPLADPKARREFALDTLTLSRVQSQMLDDGYGSPLPGAVYLLVTSPCEAIAAPCLTVFGCNYVFAVGQIRHAARLDPHEVLARYLAAADGGLGDLTQPSPVHCGFPLEGELEFLLAETTLTPVPQTHLAEPTSWRRHQGCIRTDLSLRDKSRWQLTADFFPAHGSRSFRLNGIASISYWGGRNHCLRITTSSTQIVDLVLLGQRQAEHRR